MLELCFFFCTNCIWSCLPENQTSNSFFLYSELTQRQMSNWSVRIGNLMKWLWTHHLSMLNEFHVWRSKFRCMWLLNFNYCCMYSCCIEANYTIRIPLLLPMGATDSETYVISEQLLLGIYSVKCISTVMVSFYCKHSHMLQEFQLKF